MSPERRGNGEGGIWWDKERSRWRAQVFVKGSRKKFTLKAATRSAAETELRELLTKRDGHMLPTGPNAALSAWVMDWLDRADLRETVRDRYRSTLTHHVVKTWLGKITLRDLEASDLERYYSEALAGKHSTRVTYVDTGLVNRRHNPILEKKVTPRPLSPDTVSGLHRMISAALTDAVHEGRLTLNVAHIARAPKIPRKDLKILTEADTRAILEAAATRPEEAARWYLGLVFGVRPSEALAPTVDRAHPDHIEIRQQLQRIKGHGIQLEPFLKTEASNRDLPIPPVLWKMLRRSMTWKREQRLAQGPEWIEFGHDLIFVQANGLPWSDTVDQRRWKRLLEEAEVAPTKRYTARHTAVSIMLSMGMEATLVAEIVGHAKASFTMDRYGHAVEERKRAAAKRLGEFWA